MNELQLPPAVAAAFKDNAIAGPGEPRQAAGQQQMLAGCVALLTSLSKPADALLDEDLRAAC